MANVNQYAMMRAKQHEEYQELHDVIEYMNERQERVMSTMKRKQKLMEKFRSFEKNDAKNLGSWTTGSRRRNWNCWKRGRR